MPHKYLVKDIALQAGVGPATVDRVLNGRGGVRAQTAARVRHAIAELDAQAGQLALSGRRLMIDVVAEAPQNFLDALDRALAEELPLMVPSVFRARTRMQTRFPIPDISRTLGQIARRGSHGVVLMAPQAPAIASAVDALETAGIPVVTLASDMGGTRRRGYVGLDNRRAGETAAFFLGRCLGPDARIAVTLRNPGFRGEQERAEGFRRAIRARLPGAAVALFEEGGDRAAFNAKLRAAALRGIDALYSIGGGNRRLLGLIEGARPVVVAHDLQPDNLALLREGRIDLLIYHDFHEDIRNACRIIAAVAARQPLPVLPGAALRLMMPPML